MIIWLASYPKSGNTWVRTIINELLYNNNNNEIFDDTSKNIRQFPSFVDFENYLDFTLEDRTNETKKKLINETIKSWVKLQKKINLDNKIKFFKTHNLLGKFIVENKEYSFTNLENSIGVIHIVRDPRSIISSLKNHFSLETEEEAEKMISNHDTWSGLKHKNSIPNYFSSWSHHYNSWKRFPKNNLLLKYEDILLNPKAEITKIIFYLKKFFKLEVDQNKIEIIIEKTSFENFKKNESEGKFNENAMGTIKGKNVKFFYLGPKNDWKKLLQKATILKIEEKFKNEMKELGYI